MLVQQISQVGRRFHGGGDRQKHDDKCDGRHLTRPLIFWMDVKTKRLRPFPGTARIRSDMSRHPRRQTAQETVAILDRGDYAAPSGGTVSIAERLAAAV